jgi:hypothetical protein
VRFLLLVAAVGCHRSVPPPPADTGPVLAKPGTSVLLEGSSPEKAWVEARSGDPLELARLATLEGAHKLAEVAANEHASVEDRATAIRAIAMANDPSPALDALSKLFADPSVERSTLALQTLAAIAPKRAPVEEVEPGGWRTAADALMTALKSYADPVRRELAIRALHALADRGLVAKTAIPAR